MMKCEYGGCKGEACKGEKYCYGHLCGYYAGLPTTLPIIINKEETNKGKTMEITIEPTDWEFSHIVKTADETVEYAYWISPSTQKVKKVKIDDKN